MANLTEDTAGAMLAATMADGDLLRLLDTTGATVTGGSYADQAIAWTGSGFTLSNSADIAFGPLAAVSVGGWEIWDSALTAAKWTGLIQEYWGTVDGAADLVTAPGHGYSDGQPLVFNNAVSPMSPWTVYFVVGSTTDTFQIAATSGGSALDLDDGATGTQLRFGVTVDIAASDTMTVAAGAVSLGLNNDG